MQYRIVNIAHQYKEGNLNAAEAMNSITSILLPQVTADDKYIKKLIAFMWEVEPNALDGTKKEEPATYAKTMYTKVLKEKHGISSMCLGNMLDIRDVTIRSRLASHNRYMQGHAEYKRIFNIISKVI